VTFDPINVSAMMRDYGIRPKKGLGQNFLIDENFLERIAETALAGKEVEVLEIGAGMGNLTRHLAASARQVTALELDTQLIPILKKVLREHHNVRVVQGDILGTDLCDLVGAAGYVVAANIPYYITSVLIRYLLESPLKPSKLVLTIQQEVAQRICARAGKLSLLALGVQVYGSPQIAFKIPAGAFYPVPNVDSAVLTVDLYPEPLIPSEKIDLFFMLAKTAFTQKRKMLHNSLAGVPGIRKGDVGALFRKADIDPERRAQTLTIEEWKCLVSAYESMTGK